MQVYAGAFGAEWTMAQNRFLFIDALRIVAICFILVEHIISSRVYPFLSQYYFRINLWNMYDICYGSIGVWLFLFVSGFSLACNYLTLNTRKDIIEFYKKRLLRIYRAYWLAIILTITIKPWIIQQQFSSVEVIKLITGFQAWGAKTGLEALGKVNGPFWFLTPLLSLYILYPIIAQAMRKHPHISLLMFFAISQLSIFYLSNYTPYSAAYIWFPLCRIFEFSLGIYLVKINLFPKHINKSRVMAFLSNITFYMFLINEPLYFSTLQYPILFFTSLFTISIMMYAFDKQLHSVRLMRSS